MGKRYFCL